MNVYMVNEGRSNLKSLDFRYYQRIINNGGVYRKVKSWVIFVVVKGK